MDVLIFSDFFDGFIKNASSLRLANELRKDGFVIRQIHHFIHFTDEELEQIIDDFASKQGKVVCISTSFLARDDNENYIKPPGWGKTKDGVDIFKKILYVVLCAKKKHNLKVMIGGWEVELRKFLNKEWGFPTLMPFVDHFIIGSGANTIKKVLNGETIDKIAQSDPIEDYSDISTNPTKEDVFNQNETLYFEIASGCVFSCHFCNFGSLGKKKHEYMRDYDSLKREIVSNYENFGTRMYNLTDNISNDYMEKMRMLVRIKDETGIDFKWAGYVRLDTIKSKEQADLIRDSGMIGAIMGVESFTPSVGRYIGKMTDGERLKDTLRMCRESWGESAVVSAMMITGLPTETDEQARETFEFFISEEGRYLVDTFKYTLLAITLDNDNKNEINKSRNHPFKDYKIQNYITWESPWTDSIRARALANEFNNRANQKTYITAHNMAMIGNLGFSPEEIVAMARNGTKHWDYKHFLKTKQKIEEYRRKVLTTL